MIHQDSKNVFDVLQLFHVTAQRVWTVVTWLQSTFLNGGHLTTKLSNLISWSYAEFIVAYNHVTSLTIVERHNCQIWLPGAINTMRSSIAGLHLVWRHSWQLWQLSGDVRIISKGRLMSQLRNLTLNELWTTTGGAIHQRDATSWRFTGQRCCLMSFDSCDSCQVTRRHAGKLSLNVI